MGPWLPTMDISFGKYPCLLNMNIHSYIQIFNFWKYPLSYSQRKSVVSILPKAAPKQKVREPISSLSLQILEHRECSGPTGCHGRGSSRDTKTQAISLPFPRNWKELGRISLAFYHSLHWYMFCLSPSEGHKDFPHPLEDSDIEISTEKMWRGMCKMSIFTTTEGFPQCKNMFQCVLFSES